MSDEIARTIKPKMKPAPTAQQLLSSPFSERKLERELEICKTARLVLSMCGYRRAPEHYCYVKPALHYSVWGGRRRSSSFIVVQLASPMRWQEEVYGRGLAGASGYFVFAVVTELADGSLLVMAAKQARGCALTLAPAVARKERGRWLLGWSGLPEDRKLPPPKPKKRDYADYYRLAEWRRMAKDLGF